MSFFHLMIYSISVIISTSGCILSGVFCIFVIFNGGAGTSIPCLLQRTCTILLKWWYFFFITFIHISDSCVWSFKIGFRGDIHMFFFGSSFFICFFPLHV